MSESQTSVPPDRYRRRRAAGEASRAETRRRLLSAADQLFRQRGYSGTTVAAISELAGVSVQTVYLTWGSKRDLFRAAGTAAAGSSGLQMTAGDWLARIGSHPGPGQEEATSAYLAVVSRLFTEVAVRTEPYRQLRAEAVAADPDVAADWERRQAERRATIGEIVRHLPRQQLRPGLNDEYLADTVWALASPEVYDLLTTHGGYDSEAYEAWLTSTLVAALCA